MSIVLLGATSGSVTLQEPAVAGTTVIDLPATSGTMAVTSGSPSFTNITATGTLAVNGNTTLGDATTDTLTVGVTGIVKDASGNVGIGTASPSKKLVVSNSGAAGLEIDPFTRSATTGTSLLSYNRSTSAFVRADYDAEQHLFFTSTTERMRIDTSGNLLVGGTASTARFVATTTSASQIVGRFYANTASYTTELVQIITDAAASTAYNLLAVYYSGGAAYAFKVRGDGLVYSATLVGGATTLSVDASGNIIRTPSDVALKTNVQTITYGLDTVMKLKPIKHDWVESIDMGPPSIGFIAQDMELEVPEVISGTEYKSIDYPKLTAVLTKAIQEQQALITQLQADVAALKGA